MSASRGAELSLHQGLGVSQKGEEKKPQAWPGYRVMGLCEHGQSSSGQLMNAGGGYRVGFIKQRPVFVGFVFRSDGIYYNSELA